MTDAATIIQGSFTVRREPRPGFRIMAQVDMRPDMVVTHTTDVATIAVTMARRLRSALWERPPL
jgi:hypothetical protein